MKSYSFVFGLLLMVFLFGCSGKFTSEEFIREDVDFDAIRRIAVLPFASHTQDRHAHQRARNIATTQILALGVADVVDRGIVDSVLQEEVIDPNQPIDLLNLKRLGQRLNVQGFLIGSVDLSGSSGKYPTLGLTLRLIDAQSATVLWQSSGSWNTETSTGRIFGAKPVDLYHINLMLLEDMLKSLSRK